VPSPLPVIPGAYHGTLSGEFEGLPAGNVFNFLSSNTTADQPNAEARALTIATLLANSWGTHMMSPLHNSYSGSTARVYALQYPTSPAQEFHATNSGGAIGTLYNVSSCVLIKHVVRRRGKGSQGRTYISPLTQSQTDSDARTLTDGAVADFTTRFNAFIDEVITTYGGDYPSESLKYVELSRVGTGATYDILSSTAEKGIASQRRRARRREIG